MKKKYKIKFSTKELNWIERTADIESAMAMNKFFEICKTDFTKLDNKEKEMIKNIATELVELYVFLKELRLKLEKWDCRYDIETEININEDKEHD